MAQRQEFVMTRQEYEALLKRQEYLTTERRQEVAQNLQTARGFGDLSENAEYDDAKNEQAILEAEIVSNDVKLSNAKIIDESDIDESRVHIGSIVTVYDKEFDEEVTYSVVGSAGNDPLSNKISQESPIGAALLGKEVGDLVVVETPGGVSELKVLAISVGKGEN
ncbi:MAG: transcription elongation factor GreA [Clostridia bacterium]|jgi:transcription elongation factor GreA|nr:transcription elongation factor GreA [Clostridia bacterium]